MEGKMKLSHLKIKNFRNFELLNVDLTNQNVIFGLNDIGKSNFLSALRFLLDGSYRKNGFRNSDFLNKDIEKLIEITLLIEVTDNDDDDDSKKIFKMMKGAVDSKTNGVYFQLRSTYDSEKSIGEPTLFWGIDLDNLEDIPSRQSYFELDRYFNVVYIDSSIKLENTFKKYTSEIFRKESSLSVSERDELKSKIDGLNECVSQLSAIKAFENEMVIEYKKFRDEANFDITIQSEIEVSNLHSKLTPYILDEDSETYPTSGDGRKKILAYTLLTLENRRKEEEMINIFLIEELENHLHRSMQIALSYEIFSDELFKYLFLTTHSSLIVSQMDNVNLIKLVKECSVIGKSHTYSVPDEYKKLKQKLNQNMAEAIYADVVLLVEGPSEKILFDRVLFLKCPRYESFGGYILEVQGINFKEYYSVLKDLGIKVIVRTDNDLKYNKNSGEINLLGLNRCLLLAGEKKLENRSFKTKEKSEKYQNDELYRIKTKRYLYDERPEIVNELKESLIYLSRVELENDLSEVISGKMNNLAIEEKSTKSGVDFLQSAKLINMISLCKSLTDDEIEEIYNHDRFECLRKLVELCCQKI